MKARDQLLRFYNNNLTPFTKKGKVVAEYVWIDGTGINLRSKARTIDRKVEYLEDLPDWSCDGSSCYLATTKNSELILRPVAFYQDPIRKGDHVLVMCDTYVKGDDQFKTIVPSKTNFRYFAKKIFEQCKDEKPWFGLE